MDRDVVIRAHRAVRDLAVLIAAVPSAVTDDRAQVRDVVRHVG